MKPMRPLFLVVVTAVCAALLWIVFSDPDSVPDSQLGNDDDVQVAEQREIAAVDNVSEAKELPAVESTDTTSDERVEVELKSEGFRYKIHVIDESGSSLPGELIYWSEFDEGPVNRFGKWQHSAAWNRSPSNAHVVSNEDGRAVISSTKRLFAHVVEFGKSGIVVCGDEEHPPNAAGEYALIVKPRRMLEVVVLSGSGEPLKDDRQLFEFDIDVCEIAELEALPDDADENARDRVWKQDNAIGMLADGRRYLSLDLCSWAVSRIRGEHGPLRHRVKFLPKGGAVQVKEVESESDGPIVFQLPATGAIAIQLVGAPACVVPSLRVSDQEERGGFLRPIASEPDDGWYRFNGIEVGKSFEVQYLVHFESNGRKMANTAVVPSVRVDGPVQPGEIAEHSVPFRWPAGYRGVFNFPDVEGFDQLAFADEMNRTGSVVKFTMASQASQWASCTVFPDGSFCIPVQPRRDKSEFVANLTGFEVRADGLRNSRLTGDKPWRATRAWASVEASMPSLTSVVDVGVIDLDAEDPLLRVKVIDSEGVPVPHAGVRIAVRLSREESTELKAHGQGVSSDDIGEAWFVGGDWYDFVPFPKPGTSEHNFGDIVAVGVAVNATGFIPQTVPIRMDQSEVEVRLNTGSTISGSIVNRLSSPYVRVSVVPAGKSLPSNSSERVAQVTVDGRREQDGKVLEFEIAGIPEGVWEVVFQDTQNGFADVLRIADVGVSGNGVLRDPRLERIDLADIIELALLRLRKQSGAVLTAKELAEATFKVRFSDENGGATTDRAKVDRDQLSFALGDERRDYSQALLVSERYQSMSLQGLTVGEQELTVVENPEFSLSVEGFEQLPNGATLTLDAVGGIGSAISWIELGDWSSKVGAIYFEGPGSWQFNGRISGPNNEWSVRFSDTLEIDQGAFDAVAPLTIGIPQEILDEIPR